MVSITSKSGVKVFFRNDNEVVVQQGAMELSISVGVNMKIKCVGKLEIEAAEIAINAKSGNLDLRSGADVKVAGLNISNNANMSFAAKGSASAELSAAGETTIKGAMVMIN